MGRRKDKGMEALQGMLEELLETLEENSDLAELPFGDVFGDDDADMTIPEWLHVRIDPGQNGEDMLDNQDKDDLMDLASDMYYPEDVSDELSYRQLRELVHRYILEQPEKFLSMLPGAVADALAEALRGEDLSFDSWGEDLITLSESGFCVFDAEETVVIPEEYAVVYREVLARDEVQKKLAWWSELEDTATDILMETDDGMPMHELIRKVQQSVRAEDTARKGKKVVAFESPSAAAQEQVDEIFYVLINRLTGWDTDIMMFEEDDDIYLTAMDWDDFDDEDDDSDWDDFDDEDDDSDWDDFDDEGEDSDWNDFDEEDDDYPFK